MSRTSSKNAYGLLKKTVFVTVRLSTAAIRTVEKRGGVAAVVREMRARGEKI